MLALHKAGATQDTTYRILNKMRPALLQSRSYTGHNLQDFKQDVTCPFTKQMLHRTQLTNFTKDVTCHFTKQMLHRAQLTEFYTRCDLPFHKAEATQDTTYRILHKM